MDMAVMEPVKSAVAKLANDPLWIKYSSPQPPSN